MVSKTHGLRWIEALKESQRITAREERLKEEVVAIFRELYDISALRMEPPVFPPWQAPY